MKKIIASVIVLSSIVLCSCSGNGKEPGTSLPAENGTSQTSAALTSESQTRATEDARDARISEMESQIEDMRARLEELNGVKERLADLEELFGVEYKGGEYVYINGIPPFKKNDEKITFHEEYDDTSVVNAYLTGDGSSLDRKDKEVYSIAKDVLSDIIKDGMSDYDKELAVHDWICGNIVYDSEELAAIPAASVYSHTPYGALKYKRAICLGYATTFKLFLDMLEIDNRLIHVNNNDGDEHSWNLVKIGESWYHADSAWDASGKDSTAYFYFNITDAAAVKCGFFQKSEDLPAADSIEYNYYMLNGKELDGTDGLKEMIKALAAGNDGKAHGVILDGDHEENLIRETVGNALYGTGCSAYVSHPCTADGKTVFAVYLKKN